MCMCKSRFFKFKFDSRPASVFYMLLMYTLHLKKVVLSILLLD